MKICEQWGRKALKKWRAGVCALALIGLISPTVQAQEPTFSSTVQEYLETPNPDREVELAEIIQSAVFAEAGKPDYFAKLGLLQTIYDGLNPEDDERHRRFTLLAFDLQDAFLFHNLDFIMNLKDENLELSLVGGGVGALAVASTVFILAKKGFIGGVSAEVVNPKVVQNLASKLFRQAGSRFLSRARLMGILARNAAVAGRSLYGVSGAVVLADQRQGEPVGERLPEDFDSAMIRIQKPDEYYPSPLELLSFNRENHVAAPVNPISFEDNQFLVDVISIGGGFVLSLISERTFHRLAERGLLAIQGLSTLTRVRSAGFFLSRFTGPMGLAVGAVVWSEVTKFVRSALEWRHGRQLRGKIDEAFAEFENAERPAHVRRAGVHLVNAIGEFSGYLNYGVLSRYIHTTEDYERRLVCLAVTQPAPQLSSTHWRRHPEWRPAEAYAVAVHQTVGDYETRIRAIHEGSKPEFEELERYILKAREMLERKRWRTHRDAANRLSLYRQHIYRQVAPDQFLPRKVAEFHREIERADRAKENRDRRAYDSLAARSRCRSAFEEAEFQ